MAEENRQAFLLLHLYFIVPLNNYINLRCHPNVTLVQQWAMFKRVREGEKQTSMLFKFKRIISLKTPCQINELAS